MSLKPRIKYWLGNHWQATVGVLIALTLLTGGGAAYTYLNPPVEFTTVDTNQQQLTINSSTEATVTEARGLYNLSETISDAPIYFIDSTPNATYYVTIDPPVNTKTNVTAVVRLQLYGKTDGDIFWQKTRTVTQVKTTTRNNPISIRTPLNLNAILTTLGEKRAATRGQGVFGAKLHYTIHYDTGLYSDTITTVAPINYQGRAVRFGDVAVRKQHSQPVVRRMPAERPTPKTIVLSAGAFVFLVGAIASYYIGRDTDTEAIRHDVMHIRYTDWISSGEIPTYTKRIPIKVTTLSDLVNIAIDSNQRVIYNDNYEIYGIISNDILYYYARDDRLVDEWFTLKRPDKSGPPVDELNDPHSPVSGQGATDTSSPNLDYLELFEDDDISQSGTGAGDSDMSSFSEHPTDGGTAIDEFEFVDVDDVKRDHNE